MMRALSAVFLLAPALLTAQFSGLRVSAHVLWLNQEPSASDETAQAPEEQSAQPEESAAAKAATGPLTAVCGVVTNSASGQGVARALVRLEGDAENGVLTDGAGHFELSGIPAGPQIFQILKPGFRDPAALEDASGEGLGSTEHNVLVAAQMPELSFTLTPTCAIRGQVELGTGDPAGGIVIRLLRQSILNGRAVWGEARFVRTNALGNYRFGGLPEGVYAGYNDPLLESAPATTLVEPGSGGNIAQNGYPAVFYPGARELAGAALIRLAAGDETQANLLLTLEPFHTVTAAILAPGGHGAALDAGLPTPMLLDTANHMLPYEARYDETTHTVQAELPDGTYTLAVATRGRGTGSGAAETAAHPGYLAGSVEFSVAGQAVRNLQIPLLTPHSALLRLWAQRGGTGTFPSAGLRSAVQVSLRPAGEYRAEVAGEKSAPNAGSDSFDLMLAPPFSYWVHTLVYGKGLCAGAFNANGPNLAREPLALNYSGTAAPMELILRNDCSQLNLNLPAAGVTLAPGIEPVYTVYVVPDFDTTEDVQPVTLRPTSGGSLTVEGLTPGDYRVYTFNAPVELEYRNPAALAQLHSQSVTLSPGGTADLVLEVPAR